MYIGLNERLQDDIINGEFGLLSKVLQDPQGRQKLNAATWQLLSSHLDGTVKRKRGPRFSREKHLRNEKAWRQHRQLMQEGLTYEEAIAEMAVIEAERRDEGKEPTEYEGKIRGHVQEYHKWQKEEAKRAKEDEDFCNHLSDLHADSIGFP